MKILSRYIYFLLLAALIFASGCGNDDDDDGNDVDIVDFAVTQIQNNTQNDIDPIDINQINFVDREVLLENLPAPSPDN